MVRVLNTSNKCPGEERGGGLGVRKVGPRRREEGGEEGGGDLRLYYTTL